MEEIWIDIKDYEGLYQVSNFGRIKSLGNGGSHKKEKILNTDKTNSGHLRLRLHKNGKGKKFLVHVIVAKHFIYNDDILNKTQVHHIDKNPQNNKVDNLMWVTDEEHRKLHPERYEKLRKSINQYDLDGNFIKTWKSSTDIQRELGYNRSNIIQCCRENKNYTHAYGYIWKYALLLFV